MPHPRTRPRNSCLNCSKETTNQFYCSRPCQSTYQRKISVRDWLAGKISGRKGNDHRGTLLVAVREYILERDSTQCVSCGQGEVWNEKPLTLQIDHISGNWEDSSPENLRTLCPNCHTQTSNYGSKNKGYGRPKR